MGIRHKPYPYQRWPVTVTFEGSNLSFRGRTVRKVVWKSFESWRPNAFWTFLKEKQFSEKKLSGQIIIFHEARFPWRGPKVVFSVNLPDDLGPVRPSQKGHHATNLGKTWKNTQPNNQEIRRLLKKWRFSRFFRKFTASRGVGGSDFRIFQPWVFEGWICPRFWW